MLATSVKVAVIPLVAADLKVMKMALAKAGAIFLPRIVCMKRGAIIWILAITLTACGAPQKSVTVKEPVEPKNITIAFGGDTHGVAQISKYLERQGNPFSGVAKLLTDADISVINLESAVTTQTEHQEKQYFFNSNPLILDQAAASGVDIVNLGNNHAGDYFRNGLSDSIKAAEAAGLKVIGAGNSGREAWTSKIVNVRGTKVAFLGIAKINSGVVTTASGELAGTTDGWNNQVIELAIKAAARQAKIVIVYTHWGVEEKYCPENSEVTAAKNWLDWGATAIIGSHPHRQQPAVRYGEKIVDYSLGNLIFYTASGAGLDSGIGYLTLSPEGKALSYKFYPAKIDPQTGSPILLSGAGKEAAIAKKQRFCKSLNS